jgi:hypothetical protein
MVESNHDKTKKWLEKIILQWRAPSLVPHLNVAIRKTNSTCRHPKKVDVIDTATSFIEAAIEYLFVIAGEEKTNLSYHETRHGVHNLNSIN